jgi:two-component system phosphate regulon sensor histidine kinase PhoR
MRKRRLLGQLFFAYLAITLAVMAVVVFYASREVQQLHKDNTALRLELDARQCEAELAGLLETASAQKAQEKCVDLGDKLGCRLTMILPSGKVLADSDEDPKGMDNHYDRPEVAEALHGGVGRETRYSNTLKDDLFYVAVPVYRGGSVAGVIRASVPVRSLVQTLQAVNREILAAGALAAVLVAAVSFWVSRRIIRPLDDLRRGAERFARGELRHRLPGFDSEEIDLLAEALNRMAEQLDERIQTILRQQNEREAMLSSMEEGVLAVDNEGTILSANGACARLLEAEGAALRGRPIYEVLRKPALVRFIETALAGPGPIDEDLRSYGSEDRWLSAHATALDDAQERRIGVLVVLHDITRLRRLENIRRDFVANVSHELRTPITSIKGFVETLLDEGLEDKQSALRFLGIVLKQVNRLDAIIQDLLLLSRIERGAEDQTIERGQELLGDVLGSAVEMCQRNADQKGVRLLLDCPGDLLVRINGPLVEQAVMNLVDNAVKYSEAGSTVSVEGGRDDSGVVIRVRDTGSGIAAEHLPRLFERFYRVDKARSRELGGTGLGLAIVKHIVVAHQGSIDVESTLGQGSIFTLRLPEAAFPLLDGAGLDQPRVGNAQP